MVTASHNPPARPGLRARRPRRSSRSHPVDRTGFDNDIPRMRWVADAPEAEERQTITVEVGGKRLQVSLPGGLSLGRRRGRCGSGEEKAPRRSGAARAAPGPPVTRSPPHAGHDRQDRRRGGQTVAEGDLVVVLGQ